MKQLHQSFLNTRIISIRHYENEPIGAARLEEMGKDIYGKLDPAAVLSNVNTVTFKKQDGRVVLSIVLPNLDKTDIDVGRKDSIAGRTAITEAILINCFCNPVDSVVVVGVYVRQDHRFSIRIGEVRAAIIFYFVDDSVTYEDDNLKVIQSMGLDDTYTSLNIWNLLGAIMWFRSPDIHPIINVLIAVPLWISFIWVAFYVLKELLPF